MSTPCSHAAVRSVTTAASGGMTSASALARMSMSSGACAAAYTLTKHATEESCAHELLEGVLR